MSGYDLLFIVLFLATVAAAIALLILIASGRRGAAWRILLGTGAVWCVYLAVLAASDLTARQLVVQAGEERCFDEMCFAVADVQTQSSPATKPDRTIYIVTVRETSDSRGRTQAEGGLRARLYANGTYFNVSQPAQEAYELQHGKSPGLTQRLAPAETILTVLVFDLPRSITSPGLALDHGFTPGYFVIGESPFFHEPDVLQLPLHT